MPVGGPPQVRAELLAAQVHGVQGLGKSGNDLGLDVVPLAACAGRQACRDLPEARDHHPDRSQQPDVAVRPGKTHKLPPERVTEGGIGSRCPAQMAAGLAWPAALGEGRLLTLRRRGRTPGKRGPSAPRLRRISDLCAGKTMSFLSHGVPGQAPDEAAEEHLAVRQADTRQYL